MSLILPGCNVSDRLTFTDNLEGTDSSTVDSNADGNSVSESSSEPNLLSIDDIPIAAYDVSGHHSQALLGPVVGATINVYHILARPADLPFCRTVTIDSPDINAAGSFAIPTECNIKSDNHYLVEVVGGMDIDADDDGVIDASPTPVNGSFHAYVTGQQILTNAWNVTVLTEAIYRNIQHYFDPDFQAWAAAGLGLAENMIDDAIDRQILATMDRLAVDYLSLDISGDGLLTAEDLALWHPRHDRGVFRGGEEVLLNIAGAIHQGLYDEPLALGDDAHLVSAIKTVGKSKSVWVDEGVAYVTSQFGLSMYDVSDISAPTMMGHYSLVTWVKDVVVNNGYAFILVSGGEIQVVDVSNSIEPRYVGSVELYGDELQIVNGKVIALQFMSPHIGIVGIDAEGQPEVQTVFRGPPLDGAMGAGYLSVDAQGRIHFLFGTFSQVNFVVMDGFSSVVPTMVGEYNNFVLFSQINPIYLRGDYAFTSTNEGCLKSLELTSSNEFSEVACVNGFGRVYEGYENVLVAMAGDQMEIIDISDP
ncbi:MAG: hypothetical protein JKY67_21920, partial [Pseudomonadales bacterium]|nr:hypothetical protein [Pseudomonadales bacterium]